MSVSIATQNEIREYLLGRLRDEGLLEQIEVRLMTDDGFADEVSIVEHDIIEQYLDDQLGPDEQKCFDEHFLLAKERQETMRLVEDLRDYAASQTSKSVKTDGNGWNFMAMFRWLRFASAAVIIVVAALGVWRFVIYESDTDKGLAQMRKAYQGQRLAEARITALPDYVPFVVTRGADAKLSDAAARDRAERYLLDATQDANNARAHHALSLLNFAERKYDRALKELNLALAAAPRDDIILSDAGAIYLELSKRAIDDNRGAKRYEYLNDALKYLDLAITVAPKMTEPRFNRALCLMELSIPERARSAWQEYLAIDSDSKWADEARRHLETLDKTQPKETSAADLETQFVAAVNADDEARATQLISTNRELIRDKYLPQRLAATYISVPESRRDELLRALQYAGEIEVKNTGDAFAKDIAIFYRSQGREKHDILTRAHADIRDGYTKCLNQQFGDAIGSFTAAKDKFDLAGDEWNAALANYFIGYALTNTDSSNESLHVLIGVQTYARQRHYLWLDATVSHWVGSVNQKLHRHTDAKSNYLHALDTAQQIGDGYATQRNLIELARLSAFVGQKDAALTYLSKMFAALDRQNNSERQRYRNYSIAADMLSRLKLFYAARELSFASMTLADGLGHNIWMSESRSNTGVTMMELGDFENARKLIADARATAKKVDDPITQSKLLARAAAKSAELDSKLGDFESSAAGYREAVSYYKATEVPFYPEDANKGLLASLSHVGQTDEVESQIRTTVESAESYRAQIQDTQEQIDYFSIQSGIYEMASDFELKRGNSEAAYNYTEAGDARNLLSSLRTENSELGRPLELAEIQSSLPAEVQLLQYAVLPQRLSIWVITRDKFVQRTVEIASEDISREIDDFIGAVSVATASQDKSGGGRKLFDKLIAPVLSELDQKKELAVVPDKSLFALPFAALISPDGDPLIESFTITYTPSASVYIRCGEIAREKRRSLDETFLGIGDPLFDARSFDDLTYLDSAIDEVNAVSKAYGTKWVFSRDKATKVAFLRASGSADVIHFAGHYVVTPGDPMSSFMLFAKNGDGAEGCKLTNRELATHDLSRTKLIVLAACQTGVESIYDGEGMAGLANVFLAAKVPLVVASNWGVDSAATAKLMNRFHELRSRQHFPTAQALRIAQLDMLNDDSGKFTDPFYWAGFAVFGGHAEF